MKLALILLLSAATAGAQRAESRSLRARDAIINYERAGTGTPLVLIHGWAQDLSIWDEQFGAFSGQYEVIRYDRRGFGSSTGYADASADADDLRILLDSLGIRSAFLLGLSAGSRAALNFAVANPERVRALVLYGQTPIPGFSLVPQGPAPVAVFREIAQQHGLDSAGKFLRAHPLAWMPAGRPELEQLLIKQWDRYSGEDLLAPRPESGRVPHATFEQVVALRIPTLVVSGDHDLPLFLQFGDTLVARIPGAQRVIITNAGHGAHFAQPPEFNAAVLRFLADVDRRRTDFFADLRRR
jgi:3-oxoadipate enol-lactonase